MTERRDDALFGYAELEHTDGSDDVDIHFWPTDADHILDVDLTCDCKPKIELQWANGTRVIIHRKTQ